MTKASFSTEGTYAPDKLIAGAFPMISKKVVIVSGQNVARGAVLGKITTGGKYTLSLAAAEDGSEDPVAILAESVDASGGDKEGLVFLSGEFNSASLVFGTGHTATSAADALRNLGIYVVSTVPA